MNLSHLPAIGILDLVLQAGLMAKLVLLLLLGASVFCWAIIFVKARSLRDATSQNRTFIEIFWSGKNVEEILTKASKYPKSPVAKVFQHGIKELRAITSVPPGSPADQSGHQQKLDQIYRVLSRSSSHELSGFEKHLGWLATTASAAPFVGLFGTVWGIMNSFQSIGATGTANLAVVAPGISEALVTTAAGIGAAIPAVIAYNYFTGAIKRVAIELENFSQDFIAVVQKSSQPKK